MYYLIQKHTLIPNNLRQIFFNTYAILITYLFKIVLLNSNCFIITIKTNQLN